MKAETQIRIAAGIALITALWTILPNWRSHLFLFHGLHRYAEAAGFAVTMSVVLFEFILLIQLISAIGLFRILRWAWILAVVTLSVQVLLISIGAIRMAILPPLPPPPITSHSIITTHSLLPSYFRTIMNGIAVLIIYSKNIRSHFFKQTKKSHNQSLHHTK